MKEFWLLAISVGLLAFLVRCDMQSFIINQAQDFTAHFLPCNLVKSSNSLAGFLLKGASYHSGETNAYIAGSITPRFFKWVSTALYWQFRLMGKTSEDYYYHIVDRTNMYDRSVFEILEKHDGNLDVIICGAGLDFRSIRVMDKWESISVMELDLPEVLDQKRCLMDVYNRQNSYQVEFKPINLNTSVVSDVVDVTRPALIVFEAVLPFISSERRMEVIKDVMEKAICGSYIIFHTICFYHPEATADESCVTPIDHKTKEQFVEALSGIAKANIELVEYEMFRGWQLWSLVKSSATPIRVGERDDRDHMTTGIATIKKLCE